MFCAECGKENNDNASYCSGCGIALNDNASNKVGEFKYYGRDWKRVKSLAIASLPYHDIAIDDDYIYIIELPKYSAAAWGTIIGLIVLNIIGLAIGYAIGASRDQSKRKSYRRTWIDEQNHIVSKKYEAVTIQKIPFAERAKVIELKKKSFEFIVDGVKYAFKTDSKEFEKFKRALID